jgi:serine/threonine-protein kinase
MLAPGTRLGVYEVVGPIGAGGMGEVYRARDTRLKRDVALKILPESFASDPNRLARFQREAEVLASLNHPNIAAIHGLEESNGTRTLVMELVEGETLAERVARGPISLDEALPIAKQIAEALEAAHEQAIIHRDLKPANIKVTPNGVVKVLDFGLAKLAEPTATSNASPAALSMSPTITSPALVSGVGVLLGTAAYMSPEQAKGQPAEKRSDIWAFGCVLYEIFTGRRAFEGEDVSDTLANVLKIDPDWSLLPVETPPAIEILLKSCLTKDRRRRVADISTALFVIEKAASLAATPAKSTSSARPPRTLLARRVATLTAGALVVAAIATAVTWVARRPAEVSQPRVARLPLGAGGAATLTINGVDPDLAITPDGSRVIYVGNRGTQLFVRALDVLEPVSVYTGAPIGPFVSPDGQWIGFRDNRELKKVPLSGGPPVTLTTLDTANRGATWGSDDTIIVGGTTGLQRVKASGGPATVLARADRKSEGDFRWPELLPGGRAVLFTILASMTGGPNTAQVPPQVAVLDLETGARRVLVRGGSHAHFVSSGHLIYATPGTLWAVPFDLSRLETRGIAVPVVAGVATTTGGGADAVVASDGTLAYVSGGASGAGAARTLVWVDRHGGETQIPAPPRPYLYPRLSPDGTRVVVSSVDQELDLWLWDLARATLTRLTFERGGDQNPVWTPDGKQVIYTSARTGAQNIYLQAADGTGSAGRLTDSRNQQFPTAITADGTRVVFYEQSQPGKRDLRLLTLTPMRATASQGDGERLQPPRVETLLDTPFDSRGGVLSPDGRWLAYESNSTGRYENYVRPFPNVTAGQWQVSNSGGVQPLWAHSGRELFFVAPDGALMTVPADPRGTAWSAGIPKQLIEGRYYNGAGLTVGREYDVSPDDQRFLMIKDGGASDQTAAPGSLIVVLSWIQELKRLVPTK